MHKVFIDGSHGTTGLEIKERLAERDDIELIGIPEEERKNEDARIEAAKASDLTILCLPDEASLEIAASIPEDVKVIDTATVHRVMSGWTYGFPELKASGEDALPEGGRLREKIREAGRVANPGCHATGLITLIAPLIQEGILSGDADLTSLSLTGYSGGGRKMIEEYDLYHGAGSVVAPMQYAVSQEHKHMAEVMMYSGLEKAPCFSPVVGDFFRGMEVSVPLPATLIDMDRLSEISDDGGGSLITRLSGVYSAYYDGERVINVKEPPEDGRLYADELADTDGLEITVSGNSERVLLTARFDNLGKGASGAAVQNMNLMLGEDEYKGLSL